jgi:hypothetical protein
MSGSFNEYNEHMSSIQDKTSARIRLANRPAEWYAPHQVWPGGRQKAVYFSYPLLRFERIQQRHYGMKLMAYTLINLRAFCGV